MNSQNNTIQREPLINLHDSERPQKRLKAGAAASLNIVSVLADIGATNYSRGDYPAAQQCFSQALCTVDIDYMISQAGAKRANSTTAVKTTNAVSSCDLPIECQQQKEQEKETQSKTEYDEGMRVYDTLLQIEDSSSVDEVVASLFYNLAQTHVQRGALKEAITFFHKSLDRFFALRSAKKSLCIVMNLHSLGYCHYRTGKINQAKDFYQRALATVSSLNLGTLHLAASVNCVGVTLFNQQQPCDTDLAMDMFVKSLELNRSCRQANVVAVATVLNNIGRIHYLLSDFGKAHNVYEECLRLRRECLGGKSIDVAATAYNLGQTCYRLGRLDDALSNYQEFVEIMTSEADPPSKDVALVYKGIGEIYEDKTDYKMALHFLQKALEVQEACSNGRPSADVAATLNKMGNLSYEMKDFQSAMSHYEEGLRIEQALLEPNHPHMIITVTNIGHIDKQLGAYQKALSAYTKVHHMQRKQYGDDSCLLGIAETMSSIGLMEYHLKNYEASFDDYQEALRIRRQNLGSDEHPEIASTLNSIGLVLFKQEIFELAKNCFTESLRIRSKLLGKNHGDVAILWYNIATIHFETGEDEIAIQMYKETLRVERLARGEDHPDVVLTLQHLGQVHQQLGKTEQAIDYFQEALAIERRRNEPARRSLARILNLLGNVYLQLGRTSNMMECYIEAARIFESNRVSGETLVIGGYNFYGLSKTNPPCAPVA
jgi:tetratricopeptide (TPR) repeat protein